jgi:hypothetical protein
VDLWTWNPRPDEDGVGLERLGSVARSDPSEVSLQRFASVTGSLELNVHDALPDFALNAMAPDADGGGVLLVGEAGAAFPGVQGSSDGVAQRYRRDGGREAVGLFGGAGGERLNLACASPGRAAVVGWSDAGFVFEGTSIDPGGSFLMYFSTPW